MKLKVISAFRDKDDHVTVYDPDTILEVKDKDRAQSLIDRGLCKEFKGKRVPAYILGKEEDGEAGQSGQSDGSDQSGESDDQANRANPTNRTERTEVVINRLKD
ncbi:hypothetical protein [Prevotella koreensis]|uniref:hypothetical protein n=1 Tax=Prevotella koreensis TaxID=2490854 RepID=UPI0028F0A8CF|nr:hypothetical protein [Prevotella koreensis]